MLFVCTGNTCRSPFAEGLLKKLLHDRYGSKASSVRISSAGTYAFSGVEPPPDALKGAGKFGLDLSGHRSRSIHLSMMEAADVIFCMTAMHRSHLIARFPWYEDRIFVLKKYALEGSGKDISQIPDEDLDIPDPIGQGIPFYVQVFKEIKENLEQVVKRWESEDQFRRSVGRFYRIVAGSDHGGFSLKNDMVGYLREKGHEVTDLGAETDSQPVDYPDYARPAAKAVAKGEYDLGLLVCGSGVGISIAANRVPGARAVLARDAITAKLSRNHNDSNILCLGGRFTTPTVARDILDAWLSASFEGGRHETRIKKIDSPGT